jgi:hypothetical protein
MPADLWSEAAALARSEGAYQVHRVMRVNYDGLKRRMAECLPTAPAAFVELSGAQLLAGQARTETIIEVSDGTGTRMTVRLAADVAVDVARLVTAFRYRGE